MSLGKFFSRSKKTNVVTSESKAKSLKNEIICEAVGSKELITKWAQNEGWEFENFADFIKLIGVKTPVKIIECDEENCSFKCITALNKEIHVTLFFGDGLDFCSEISITDGEETQNYITNTNIKNRKIVPEVILESRIITRNGKELKSYYCEYFCHRTLKLDKTHELKIEIEEPDIYAKKSETFVLRNCKDIEEYLLGLDKSLIVTEVYEKLMELLGFSKEDISKSKEILISYIETVNQEERVRSIIFLKRGKMQEYAILENGETYHVFKDGSWIYLSDSGIKISYLEDMNHYVFSVKGSEENIENVNPGEIMGHVKTKISELWRFVK